MKSRSPFIETRKKPRKIFQNKKTKKRAIRGRYEEREREKEKKWRRKTHERVIKRDDISRADTWVCANSRSGMRSIYSNCTKRASDIRNRKREAHSSISCWGDFNFLRLRYKKSAYTYLYVYVYKERMRSSNLESLTRLYIEKEQFTRCFNAYCHWVFANRRIYLLLTEYTQELRRIFYLENPRNCRSSNENMLIFVQLLPDACAWKFQKSSCWSTKRMRLIHYKHYILILIACFLPVGYFVFIFNDSLGCVIMFFKLGWQ